MKKLLLIAFVISFSWSIDAQMVLEFNTKLATDSTITLPLNGTVDVTVNWGDGNEENFNSTGDVNHTYDTSGIYTVTISGTLTWFGKDYWEPYANADKLVRVTSFGDLGLTSLTGAFRSAYNLVEAPDTLPSTVTSLAHTFRATSYFNDDISSWDVSNVTDMNSMFFDAMAFNQDIGGWDVSNVTDMHYMFYRAHVFNQDIGEWEVGNVTDMERMFVDTYDFNQDIGGWDVSNVTNMQYMFYIATSFDQDLGEWNVIKVTNMTHMFDGITLSTANYNSLLIGWAAKILEDDVEFDGGNSTYSPGDADIARQSIITTYNWTITDGGISNYPLLTTDSVENITHTAATSGGNITIDGGGDISARGVVWHTAPDPTIDTYTGITVDGDTTGSFISSLTSLVPGTVYYVRAYATNEYETGYGSTIEFTTLPKIELTISGSFTVDDKIYDGTTAAVIETNELALTGVTEGDTVELTDVVAEFSQVDVGTDLAVNIVSASLTGADTVKYALTLTGAPVTTADIISDVSGIDAKDFMRLTVYPNPFHDHLNLENVQDVTDVILIDITGRKVLNLKISEEISMDTSTLPGGIYFLNISYKNGTIQTEKIIKKQ